MANSVSPELVARSFRRSAAALVMSIGLLQAPLAQSENLAPALPLEPARTIEFETAEGTWLSLDISPDGTSIVFDLLGDVYHLDAGGGRATALSTGMAFDSQPVFSPDGDKVAFISDRSGAENLWSISPDGSQLRQLTFRDDDRVLVSPEWSADGEAIYASIYRADLNAYSLWRFDGSGATEPVEVLPTRTAPGQDRSLWVSSVDPATSSDGRYLYFAGHVGAFSDDRVAEWTIRRLDLQSGAQDIVVSAPRSPRPDLSLGTYFRPVISPDGHMLVYGTRFDGKTGLRLLDLETREDRWLRYPIVHDQVEAGHWQGILPRYTFSPDGQSLYLNQRGHISRIDLATGAETLIPFRALVSLGLGPSLRTSIRQETGPVRARLIQTPESSPDGSALAFSALTQVYLMDLDASSTPRRLTRGTLPEFNPSWSPDGRSIVYVTWSARDAGQIWIAPSDGKGEPRRLSKTAAYYTSPVFTPDGQSVVALRSSNSVRMHSFMEYGSLRESELVLLALDTGAARIVTRGTLGGKPGFGPDPKTVFINTPAGLNSVHVDSGELNPAIQVLGPGWYFSEGAAPVDDLKISPDGQWALAQIAQQLHVVGVPPGGGAVVDLFDPAVPFRRLTEVGADFFDWADGGDTITWAVGSSWYRRSLASVNLSPSHSADRSPDPSSTDPGKVESFTAVVELPRDRPTGSLLLSGATAITMDATMEKAGFAGGVIENADILIEDDHISAIGRRGEVDVPRGTVVRNVSGKYIVPGFIDTHDHIAEIRRGLLDLETWAPAASLAYGVTTKFDPSPLSIDMLAYEDLIDAGLITGSRIHSTGPALFSFNQFKSKDEVKSVLKRYRDHYRTFNIKMYRTGNRRVRQWVAMASAELGMMPTTEGALAMKLDLSQVMDGFAGQEHALPAAPLYHDVVTLMADSGVSYTATLLIGNGGPEAQDYFISQADLVEDQQLNRFWPRYAIDIKLRQRTWRTLDDYFFPLVAESAARIDRAGGLVAIGSHGEDPGIGFHWEMQAHAMGGMTPLEVLRAATLGGARTIGREAEFGSLTAGKYADLVILERNPLVDIQNTLSMQQVMKNGRLYDAMTLAEVWPRQVERIQPWFWNDVPVPANPEDVEPTDVETAKEELP